MKVFIIPNLSKTNCKEYVVKACKVLADNGCTVLLKTEYKSIFGHISNVAFDSEGLAKLNIALMPGEYIITSTSPNGNSISNKITVTDANRTAKQV